MKSVWLKHAWLYGSSITDLLLRVQRLEAEQLLSDLILAGIPRDIFVVDSSMELKRSELHPKRRRGHYLYKAEIMKNLEVFGKSP